MRGRKRQRKKWLKKNFIQIYPGLFIPRNSVPRMRRSYMNLGLHEEIQKFLARV